MTVKVTPVAVAALVTALTNPSVSMAEDAKVLASNVPKYHVGSTVSDTLDVPPGGRVRVSILPCKKTITVNGGKDGVAELLTCLSDDNTLKGAFPLRRR
jgi:hypothetical protein